MSTSKRHILPPGTVVDGYTIQRAIGKGGFSLIYLATEQESGDNVIIKEYLPRRYARRDGALQVSIIAETQREALKRGRELFYQEAKVLASLRHPNIVRVRNFFLANNTAYLVMDFTEGKNLGYYIRKRNGRLSTTLLLTVFPPILEALELVHTQSLLHLDIKPGNIHLQPGGDPLLLDFGAVHRFATSRRQQHGHIVTTGYSPVEQYHRDGYVGPWSDVYAIGATMRACIEGKTPPSAIERHAKDKMRPAARLFRRRYPAYLLEAIDWAMEVDPTLRPQSAAWLRQALQSEKRPSEVKMELDSQASEGEEGAST
ncbi:MAG TPA: serine/threonine protein kinase [Chromatiales bacterium]|nr:serine/threonine protein kinase [Chromatiales bacterium]